MERLEAQVLGRLILTDSKLSVPTVNLDLSEMEHITLIIITQNMTFLKGCPELELVGINKSNCSEAIDLVAQLKKKKKNRQKNKAKHRYRLLPSMG